jgi:hypothetical protein
MSEFRVRRAYSALGQDGDDRTPAFVASKAWLESGEDGEEETPAFVA